MVEFRFGGLDVLKLDLIDHKYSFDLEIEYPLEPHDIYRLCY